MDFCNYPFDKHVCKQIFGSAGYGSKMMVFNGSFQFNPQNQRPLQYKVA